MRKKVLVTGSTGQLANALQAVVNNFSNIELILCDKAQFDITEPDNVFRTVETLQPDIIVNCAAYTAVDNAEIEQTKAARVNTVGVRHLVDACHQFNATLIQLSTDYVFSGETCIPYSEDCQTSPVNFYGKTKLDAELLIKQSSISAIIIRTSWLYGQCGHNFFNTILRVAKQKSELNVVFDQVGTPTFTQDLATAILQIVTHQNFKRAAKNREIYHFSNEGVASWYDFAHTILAENHLDCVLKPISTAQYPTRAARPHYSVLSKEKIKKDFGLSIRHWHDALSSCLADDHARSFI